MRVDNNGRGMHSVETTIGLTAEQAVMAEVVEILDDVEDSARDARRAAQAARRSETAARLEHLRDAADLKFAGALVGAATKAFSGTERALTAGSSESTQRTWDGIAGDVGAAGDVAEAVIGHMASNEELAAGHCEAAAQEHGDRADELGDDVRSAQSMADRALGHMDQVQQARMQAQVAAIRG